MQHIGFAVAALGFWVFLTASAVAGIVADYKKRHLELEPLRAAIERGQQLDPVIVERLMAREQNKSEPQPVYFRIGGIVTVSVGVGLLRSSCRRIPHPQSVSRADGSVWLDGDHGLR
jgi:hypothetical protein